MNKHFLTLFLTTLLCIYAPFGVWEAFAQKTYTIKGKILDEKTKKPIPGADIFLANTSIGTASDSDGIFIIKNIFQKSLDLVIAFVGYETVMVPLKMDVLGNRSLTIILKEKPTEMKEITVTATRGEAWYRNFEMFKANFLGTDEFAKKCTIKNKDELYFNFQNSIFKAYADEALIIENPALGYILKYQLKDFVLDFKSGYFVIELFKWFNIAKKGKNW